MMELNLTGSHSQMSYNNMLDDSLEADIPTLTTPTLHTMEVYEQIHVVALEHFLSCNRVTMPREIAEHVFKLKDFHTKVTILITKELNRRKKL